MTVEADRVAYSVEVTKSGEEFKLFMPQSYLLTLSMYEIKWNVGQRFFFPAKTRSNFCMYKSIIYSIYTTLMLL